MEQLLLLDQHELGIKSGTDSDCTKVRQAARCVLFNDENEVALIYFARDNFYKLPGGGIDEGEALIDALRREVREETGYEIENIEELGIVEENRYYEGLHQRSFCYMARATEEGQIDPTAEEVAAGVELRWADSLQTAIDLVADAEAEVDEDGEPIGLEMMKLRDITILKAAEDALDA